MIEYRDITGGVEGSGDNLHGLVTPFNTWTTIGDMQRGGFKECVAPGTFKKTLQERDVVLIHNHNTAWPLARTSVPEGVGHLDLSEDASAGLRADAKPVMTSVGKDVMMLADAKVLRGMSFGFEVIKDAWTDDNGNPSDDMRGTQRTIHEVRLHEVTTTAFPAYPTTELGTRDRFGGTDDLLTRRQAFIANEQRDNPKPYGNVEYADPKNGKYPIDTEKHAKAGWAYINVASNADEYPLNGVTLESVKANIKAALKKFGVQISEENAAQLALEWRDDPSGDEYAAMRDAIRYLKAGNTDAAIAALAAKLPENGNSDDCEMNGAEGSGGPGPESEEVDQADEDDKQRMAQMAAILQRELDR